jgi:hypothetical protein
MQLRAEQIVDLVDAEQRHIGQMRIERQEDDLIFGTFIPGPAFHTVEPLFREFEEAADVQALHVIDELDTAIAALGLRLRCLNILEPIEIRDVQIWSNGSITCRLSSQSAPSRHSPEAPDRLTLHCSEHGEPLHTSSTVRPHSRTVMTDDTKVHIESSNLTFEAVAAQTSSNVALRRKLAEADVVLLPLGPVRGSEGEVFTGSLAHLYEFIRTEGPTLRVEVASESDEPAELILHGEFFDLGRFLVVETATPLLIGILANYVWSKLGSNSRKRRAARVQCEIITQLSDGSSWMARYDGPADTFEKTVRDLSAHPPSGGGQHT